MKIELDERGRVILPTAEELSDLVRLEDKMCGLHVHSEHSFLDGYSKVEHIAQRAKKLGQPAVAITDHGECGGHLMFQKACQAEDIKPIFGMEGYWVWDVEETRAIKDRKLQRKNSHITLLAQNEKGLRNLWAWSTRTYHKPYHFYKPLADIELMKEYSEGIYASDGCLLTEFSRAVTELEDEDRARQILGQLLAIFGDRFYMELHTFAILDPIRLRDPNQVLPGQSKMWNEDLKLNSDMTAVNQAKVRLGQEMGIPLVVVNDCHYSEPQDWENHALVWDMNTRGNTDQTESRSEAAAWHMHSAEAIWHLEKYHGIDPKVAEEAIKNSYDIAMDCNVEIKSGLRMPSLFKSVDSEVKAFKDLLEDGFKRKVIDKGKDLEKYFQRMEEEADLIISKDFAGYFLIENQLVKAAKDGSWSVFLNEPFLHHEAGESVPLLVGAGRGSAGGSLVAYLLDITEQDPVEDGLLFGRFLTPSRKGFPDIDTDIPQSYRPAFKRYIQKRYGEGNVSAIGTRSRLQPRGILQDLCRAMSIPHNDSRAMAEIIDQVSDIDTANIEIGWDEVLAEKGGDLAPWAEKYPRLFQKMGEMAGLIRQSSTHAAGILIAKDPLLGDLPLRVKNEVVTTQFDMFEVEELGFVKFDFLGIRHLDTLMVARQLIYERHGIWLDYYNFTDEEHFNQTEIWENVDRGRTNGMFQLEAPGMTKVAMSFKPRSRHDVADLISVNRPGVVRAGLLHPYLRRRAGTEAPEFDHPLMEGIVGESYGIIVYQEQVLLAVQQLAGFTVDEADGVRKILGKMLYSKMKELKDKFVEGCLANENFVNHPRMRMNTERATECAEKIWNSIQECGVYVFNKSHAKAYSWVASCEAWVKYHYFPEFIAALMQTDSKRINRYVREARRDGIQILPPDVNESGRKFTLGPTPQATWKEERIRYGLDSVHQVGPAAVKDILAKRHFESLEDFLKKTDGRACKKQVVINLLQIGAFDSLGERRHLLRQYYDFRGIESVVPDFSDDDVVYRIEKELVGNFITKDPMHAYSNMIIGTCIQHPEEMNEFQPGDDFIVGGQLTRVKLHYTKSGRNPGAEMAFLNVTWNEENFDVVCFPQAWEGSKVLLKEGAPVAIQCQKLGRGACVMEVQRLDFILQEAG